MNDFKYTSDRQDIEPEALCKRRDSFEKSVPTGVMRNLNKLISVRKNEVRPFFSSNDSYPVKMANKEYPLQKPKQVIFSVVAPPFDTLKIRLQRCPYNRSNSFLLTVPSTTLKSAELD